jgi:hypothetical protein
MIDCSGSQFGICLFVDGLDEYIADQGTHTELAEFFFTICRSSKIKAVLSSRPLPAFEEVFGGCPMLRLQDLTKHDIDFYVQSVLKIERYHVIRIPITLKLYNLATRIPISFILRLNRSSLNTLSLRLCF